MRTEKDRKNYRDWYNRNKKKTRKRKTELMRKYRAENPEKYRKQSRDAKARLREKIYEIYGRKCVDCGFEDARALTLDHIKNNGSEERKQLGERGVYLRATNQYLPEDYQILCMNCQFIKRAISG